MVRKIHKVNVFIEPVCHWSEYRYGVGVVYLKLSRLVIFVRGPGGEQVEEHLQQVHVLSGHIGNLKDGAHPRGAHNT